MEATLRQDATKQDKCAIRKRAKQYRVQDGQLYRVICSDSINGDALSLYIKDAKTRKQIINGCHIGLAGNHEGRDRTLAKIAQKYFWPGLSKDVRIWVSYLSCHFYYCQHLDCLKIIFVYARCSIVINVRRRKESLIIQLKSCTLYQFPTVAGSR